MVDGNYFSKIKSFIINLYKVKYGGWTLYSESVTGIVEKFICLEKNEMLTFQKFPQMIFGKNLSIKYRDKVWRRYRLIVWRRKELNASCITVIEWFDAVFAVFLVSRPVSLSEMRHSACCIDLVLHFLQRVLQKFFFLKGPTISLSDTFFHHSRLRLNFSVHSLVRR